MITSIRGKQDTGKTALMVAQINRLLVVGRKWPDGYRPDDVHVNYKLLIPGVHCYNNDGIRSFVKDMVKKGLRHKIVGITEADRVFPARFWQDREQSEILIGLWQDVKLFNQVFWDAHIGTSVDLMLRETRQVSMIPKYNKFTDNLRYTVINSLTMRVIRRQLNNVSRTIFPLYDRWEVIT